MIYNNNNLQENYSIKEKINYNVESMDSISEEEKIKQIYEFNQTECSYDTSKTITKLFEEQVNRTPDNIAIVFEGTQLTYKELNEKANKLAHYLLDEGIQSDDLVAICVDRSLEMMIGLLAILKSGGAYLPIDPTYPSDRIKFTLEDSNAKLLLTQVHLKDSLPKVQSKSICIDDKYYSEFSSANCNVNVKPTNLAYVIYTSGTTGRPKGVMIEHRNVNRLFQSTQDDFNFSETDVWTLFHSFAFDFSVWEIWGALLYGGKLVVVPYLISRSPEDFYQLLLDEKVTILNQTPSAFKQIINVDRNSKEHLGSLRQVIFGGEKLDFSPLVTWYEKYSDIKPQLVNMYGITETTVHTTYKALRKEDIQNPRSLIGETLKDLGCYILDEDKDIVPHGVSGELYITGDGLARGYLNQPALTEERFMANPFVPGTRMYKTGDLARYTEEWDIEYIGRTDDQIQLRGFRIELGEIEQQLLATDGIKESVVLVKEDTERHQTLVGYVITEKEIKQEQIKAKLSQVLPEYMIPNVILELENMPLTPNGKVDKKVLSKLKIKIESSQDYIAPRNDMEIKLSTLFCEVLNLEKIGVHDNFFEVGGHSLLAVKLVSKIRKFLNIELPVQVLYKSNNVELLADYIKNEGCKASASEIKQVENRKKSVLSYAQESLYFIDQLEKGTSTAYNIAKLLRLSGHVNISALSKTFKTIVKRHESLRTNFTMEDATPIQIVNNAEDFELKVVNCTKEEMLKDSQSRLVTPFNLEHDMLFEVVLYVIDVEEYYLYRNIHHIISDGWSTAILAEEITTLYTAYNLNKENPLPALSLQYIDYATWQKDNLSGRILEDKLLYWKDELNGFSNLELPTTFSRPLVLSTGGKTIDFVINKEITSKLNSISKEFNTTLYMNLLSCFFVLLNRYSQQDDIIIGTPIANRNHAEIEDIMGYFINTLVVRQTFSADMNFNDLLLQVKDRIIGSYSYQDVPLEKIVQALNVPRELSRSPLFQVMFVLQNNESETIKLPELDISEEALDINTTQFDLTLTMEESQNELKASLNYSTDLFSQSYIESMIENFQVLLKSITQNVKENISEYALLCEGEKRKQLEEYNPIDVEYSKEKTIHKLFEEQAVVVPNNIAVTCDGESISYKELNERANQLAYYLIEKGVEPDDLVAICIERSLEMMIAILAILKAGGAYVPVDPAYPRDRIEYILKNSNAKLLLTEEALLSVIPNVNSLKVCIDSFDVSQYKVINPQTSTHSKSLAYVIYTSGSTGNPKGVMVEHQSAVNLISSMENIKKLDPSANSSVWTTYSFDVSVYELLSPLINGRSLYIVPADVQKDEYRFFDWLNKNEIQSAYIPPFYLAEYYEYIKRNQTIMKRVLVGVEPISYTLLHNIQSLMDNGTVINGYGPTEATVCATSFVLDGKESQPLSVITPIGKALDNTQIYILDGNNHLVPKGVSGELHIAGDGLARGYLDQPELTEEKFINNPFKPNSRMYKTGDLVKYTETGDIEYLGRIDDQVKVRGFRIELGEIEQQLLVIKEIKQSAVITKDDTSGNKVLVAYIISAKEMNVESIKEQLAEYLPEYMIPSAIISLDAIPLTPNGKVDKKALAKLDVKIESSKEYVAPRNEMEESLASIFSEVLKIEKVGVYDSFFELGGHSLLATQLVSKIRQELEVEVPLRVLFQNPNIEALNKYIKSHAIKSTLGGIDLVEDRDNLVLSFAQERLWFLDQLEEGQSTTFHIPWFLKLKGTMNKRVLELVFETIIQRHESLRTNFVNKDDITRQVISSTDTFELENISCSKKEMQGKVEALMQTPFDLGTDSLFYVKLFTVQTDEHYLFINMHHIISDGWSLSILEQEMSTLYTAYMQNKANPLKPLKTQYADYATWQKKYLSGAILDEKLSFWKDELEGVTTLELATSYPRPLEQSYKGNVISFEVNEDLTAKLNKLSKEADTTLFMSLLSSFSLLLHRYTGQEDIVIGSPIANRNRSEIEELIGFFVNTLALRQTYKENMSFSNLLEQVKEKTLNAYEHQDVPFEKIVDVLKMPRDTSRSPLFQVLFSLQNNADVDLDLVGLEVSTEEIKLNTSKYDLSMYITEVDNKLQTSIEYATDLFSEEYIQSLIENFQVLLTAITQNVNKEVSQYPLLEQRQETQLLAQYNETETKYDETKTIHQAFEEQVEKTPNKIAVKFENQELSYKELNEKSNQLAYYLIEQGIEPDDMVGICVERSIEMMIGLLAILKAGGAYVPIDPNYPSDRIAYMIENSNARLVLTQTSLQEILPKTTNPQICLDTLDVSKNVKENTKTNTKSTNLAYVIYTSGSTGLPKGVMIEHCTLVNFLISMQTEPGLIAQDHLLAVTPISFDIHTLELYLPLITGAKLSIASKEVSTTPELLAQTIKENQVNVMQATPATWTMLLNNGWNPTEELKILCGGEAISETLKQDLLKFKNLTLHNMYGPTETTVWSTTKELKANEITYIGHPINNTQLYILDKNNQLVPKGIAGELHIAGDGLARGYLHQPELTKEKFIDNPFMADTRMYKTGDLVKYTEDGNIEYLGRIDDQVKIRGYRIELGEIEQQLLAIEEIKQSVVLAKEDAAGQQALVTYIVVNKEIEQTQIKVALAEHLPEFMIPSAITIVESMPLTPNGKVDKKALAKLDVIIESSKEYIAPRNDTEEKLASIFKEVLKLEKVGIYDDFFEMGGHSLLAISLMTKINKAFKTSLPLTALFQSPNIVGLSILIKKRDGKHNILVPIQIKGKKNPIYCLPGIGGTGLEFKLLSNVLGPEQPFFGLQSIGFDGKKKLPNSIEEIALINIKAMKSQQPKGPYRLIGFSFGGLVAYEMARILGDEIDNITLLDTGLSPKLSVKEHLRLYVRNTSIYFRLLHFRDLIQKRKLDKTYIMKKITSNNYFCGVKYDPKSLLNNVNVNLVLASDGNRKEKTKEEWKKVCGENISFFEIKGGHSAMVREEEIDSLGELLKKIL